MAQDVAANTRFAGNAVLDDDRQLLRVAIHNHGFQVVYERQQHVARAEEYALLHHQSLIQLEGIHGCGDSQRRSGHEETSKGSLVCHLDFAQKSGGSTKSLSE